MPNFFDSTLAGPTANSYISVAIATEKLEALPSSDGVVEWLGYTEEEKERSLVAATMVLDPLNWRGSRCSSEQQLNWPRNIKDADCTYGSRVYVVSCEDLPHNLEVATAYLAAFLGSTGGFTGITSPLSPEAAASAAQLEQFEEVRVGPITVKPKQESEWAEYPESNLKRIPPLVSDLIKPFLAAFAASEARLRRTSVARSGGYYIGSPAYSGKFYLRNGKVFPRFGSWQ